MAGKTDVFSNDLLKLIFHGVEIPSLAQNNSSAVASLYLARRHKP